MSKQVKETTETTTTVTPTTAAQEMNLNDLTTLRNLCSWDLHFSLSSENRDLQISPNGILDSLTRREVISLCRNGNIFFVGTDGKGAHARIYIEDAPLREFLHFDNGAEKQNILDDEKCNYILELKTHSAFEKNIKEAIVTAAEKEKIIAYARKVKLNDFDKINFLEEYTEKKFKI